ncbi:MAG: ABC transporter ATP-binding protein [Thermoplasmatota archaeon]
MAEAVIKAQGLVKRFGEFTAVAGIDLAIPRGVCYGLLGPNGAGKTTTIRMIQCVSPVTEGRLTVLGDDVQQEGRSIRGRLGVVPQEDNLDPDFTVRDNLTIYARFFDVPADRAADRADELLAFLNLEDKRDARVDALSGGMKRRLVVARALMADPEVLVLDEPTTGLDPQARHALWDTIRRLRRQGKTILLTTHYMDEAEMLCDELVIVDEGKVHEKGRPRELIAKHCGSEAVEFVAAEEDTATLDDLAADLEGAKVRHERVGDRVIAYGDRLEGLQTRMRKRHAVTESVLRRASLEDVFLRLTGRALRE